MQTPLLILASVLLSDTVKKPITLAEFKRVRWFCTTASNYVKGIDTTEALRRAWRRLPQTIQQSAMAIAQEQGIGGYFAALVGMSELTDG
jgi:hypothetical protein